MAVGGVLSSALLLGPAAEADVHCHCCRLLHMKIRAAAAAAVVVAEEDGGRHKEEEAGDHLLLLLLGESEEEELLRTAVAVVGRREVEAEYWCYKDIAAAAVAAVAVVE